MSALAPGAEERVGLLGLLWVPGFASTGCGGGEGGWLGREQAQWGWGRGGPWRRGVDWDAGRPGFPARPDEGSDHSGGRVREGFSLRRG